MGLVLTEEWEKDVVVTTVQALQSKQLAADGDIALDHAELDTLPSNDCLDLGATLNQDLCSFDILCREDRDRALGDDARLLARNLHDRVSEILTVIEPDGSHDVDEAVCDIGRIPGAAHADLDDGDINGCIGEGCECQCSHHFEEGERDAAIGHRFPVDQFDIRSDVVPGSGEALS